MPFVARGEAVLSGRPVVEVYTDIARSPGVFLEDACAVIAIWTKAP
jgi:hypothetical protein